METDPQITILYRIAEKKNKTSKVKPDWISNESCLRNLTKYKEHSKLIVFGDKLEESKQLVKECADEYIETTKHGNANTFLEILEYALTLPDDNIVYFVEDDYIHRPGFEKIIIEGLERVDYISLYDHPDKYQYEAVSGLFLTKSTHWRLTSSTTMTFATRVHTLKFDYAIFREFCEGHDIPQDYYIFNSLVRNYKRKLATPIPAYATHGETKWLSPLIDWKTI